LVLHQSLVTSERDVRLGQLTLTQTESNDIRSWLSQPSFRLLLRQRFGLESFARSNVEIRSGLWGRRWQSGDWGK